MPKPLLIPPTPRDPQVRALQALYKEKFNLDISLQEAWEVLDVLIAYVYYTQYDTGHPSLGDDAKPEQG